MSLKGEWFQIVKHAIKSFGFKHAFQVTQLAPLQYTIDYKQESRQERLDTNRIENETVGKRVHRATPLRNLEHLVALLVAHDVVQVKRARIPRDRDRVRFVPPRVCVYCRRTLRLDSRCLRPWRYVHFSQTRVWGREVEEMTEETAEVDLSSSRREIFRASIIVCVG